MQTLIADWKRTREDKYFWMIHKQVSYIISAEVKPFFKQNYTEDLFQAGKTGLLEALIAIQFYDHYEQVCSYFKQYIKGEIMKELKKQGPYERALAKGTLTESLYQSFLYHDAEDRRLAIVFEYMNDMDPFDRNLILKHAIDGKTFKQIGETYKQNGQAIRRRYIKIVQGINEYVSNVQNDNTTKP